MFARLIPSRLLKAEEHNELRRQLDRFYADAPSYLAFQTASNQRHCWPHIQSHIEHLLSQGKKKVSVLEVGAGKTGFVAFLEDVGLRSSVVFHAQDVTRFNENWLLAQADSVYFGDVADAGVPGGMDVVFSTYVLEHVTDPRQHLEILWSLINPQPTCPGALFLFSPRYDMPGYLCPSARHLPATARVRLLLTATMARLTSLLTRSPQFLIQTDLAAFHLPFYPDSDAVHWVSLTDLKFWAREHSGKLETLSLGSPAIFTKDWVIKRFCTTAVKIVKSRANETLTPC